ncbi:uncharacterized protein FPRN_09968 [Fusarium proliferatum]|nr:uncharacterized protein FPRN_09968 [Fusarium proliferatum]
MARRAYFKARLTYLGVWDESKWDEIAAMVEDVASIELCQDGYRSVPRAFFDYSIDLMVWEKYVSDFKLDRYEDCWPWSIYPSIRDSRGGASPCYKEWRILNGLSIDEPDLATPTREVNPTMPTEYKSLRSSSSATACKQRPSERAGIMQASSPGPSKHLSKRAAEKQPASSPLGSDPGHALVKSPAPRPDSSGQASSSRQRVQKSRDVTRTQEPVFLTEGQAPNFSPLQRDRVPTRGREQQSPSDLQRQLASTPVSGKPSTPMPKATTPETRPSFTAYGTKTTLQATTQSPTRGHQQASVSKQPTNNPKSNVADIAMVAEDAQMPIQDHYITLKDYTPISRLPSLELREKIWKSLHMLPHSPQGPIIGFFEVALPPWTDCHDLIFGPRGSLVTKLQTGLCNRDLQVSWAVDNGRAVALVVGPHPEYNHDAGNRNLWKELRNLWLKVLEWVFHVYQGNPFRLVDFLEDFQILEIEVNLPVDWEILGPLMVAWEKLIADPAQSSAIAAERKANLIAWTPRVSEMLNRPETPLLLHSWVHECRENRDEMKERVGVARYLWSQQDHVAAFVFQRQVMDDIRDYEGPQTESHDRVV